MLLISFNELRTYPRVYVRDVCMPWAMYWRITPPYFHCCIYRWASCAESGYHWRLGGYQRFVWFNDRIDLIFLHCSGACDVPGARMTVGPRHCMKLQLLVRIGYLWSIGEDAQIFVGLWDWRGYFEPAHLRREHEYLGFHKCVVCFHYCKTIADLMISAVDIHWRTIYQREKKEEAVHHGIIFNFLNKRNETLSCYKDWFVWFGIIADRGGACATKTCTTDSKHPLGMNNRVIWWNKYCKQVIPKCSRTCNGYRSRALAGEGMYRTAVCLQVRQ